MKGSFGVAASVLIAAMGFVRPAVGQVTERVSVSSSGTQANSAAGVDPALSSDGRFALFANASSNLVPVDTNLRWDVFLHDRATGTTALVSIDSSGVQGNDNSFMGDISADGTVAVFFSHATNLVPGDTNGTIDVFVRDLVAGTTERVSVDSSGGQGNGLSFATRQAITSDGGIVAFISEASNLVAGDTNGARDVFIHDRGTGVTQRVSVDSGGAQGNGTSDRQSLSDDGSFIAFESMASNLVLGDTNGTWDAFVHDLVSGLTERVSISSGGTQGNGDSRQPMLSADGLLVVFDSVATNLVAGDTNGVRDVFVRDRTTGVTSRVSLSSLGVQGNSASALPSFAPAGGVVGFQSTATNLVVGDLNGVLDVFRHDLATGITERLSLSSAGVEGNGQSYQVAFSADGCTSIFASQADNLVASDTNLWEDIFVRTGLGCCGDGVVDAGEDCDDGAGNGTPSSCCTISCTFELPLSKVCRPAAGSCDVEELCSGSAVCPPDGVLPGGTPCADDGQFCTDDLCDGVSGVCQHPPVPDGTPCDDGEVCSAPDVCLAGLCVGTPLPATCIDRYLCYKARRTAGTPGLATVFGVSVVGAFESGIYRVKMPRVLCAPADMNGAGIDDPATHYLGHRLIPQTAPPHVSITALQVVDQFLTHSLDTSPPRDLFVPTFKGLGSPPASPPAGASDHYKCYGVRTTPGTPKIPKPTLATVTDQFQTRQYLLRGPKHLCIPVDKNGEGVVHPIASLLCYRATVYGGPPSVQIAGLINTNNQFGLLELDTKAPSELCVPAAVLP